MNKMTKSIILMIIAVGLILPAQAQVKVAQSGMQFLKVDVGARAAAMAGAFTEMSGDATVMFYNPSGIVEIESGVDVFAGQTMWIADIKYNTAAAVMNLGSVWGSVGIGLIYADYGDDIVETRFSPTAPGYVITGNNVSVGAYAAGLSYARKLTEKFFVGGQVRYVDQWLGFSTMNDNSRKKNEVSGLSFDFGTTFYPGFRSLKFGMSIRNFSREFKYEKESFNLPLTFTIGVAMNLMDLSNQKEHALWLAIDAIHPRDYSERMHVGAEYWYMGMFATRAGYKFNYDEEGFSAGVGFKYSVSDLDLRIDYAYSDFGVFDPVNRISVGFAF
jgi:hypothetical protein